MPFPLWGMNEKINFPECFKQHLSVLHMQEKHAKPLKQEQRSPEECELFKLRQLAREKDPCYGLFHAPSEFYKNNTNLFHSGE